MKEHKKLIGLLKHGSRPQLVKEANEQMAEVAKYKGKGIKEDKRYINSKTPYTLAHEMTMSLMKDYHADPSVPPSMKDKLRAAMEMKGGGKYDNYVFKHVKTNDTPSAHLRNAANGCEYLKMLYEDGLGPDDEDVKSANEEMLERLIKGKVMDEETPLSQQYALVLEKQRTGAEDYVDALDKMSAMLVAEAKKLEGKGIRGGMERQLAPCEGEAHTGETTLTRAELDDMKEQLQDDDVTRAQVVAALRTLAPTLSSELDRNVIAAAQEALAGRGTHRETVGRAVNYLLTIIDRVFPARTGGVVKQKEGESDKDYQKRLKRNEASARSKAKKKAPKAEAPKEDEGALKARMLEKAADTLLKVVDDIKKVKLSDYTPAFKSDDLIISRGKLKHSEKPIWEVEVKWDDEGTSGYFQPAPYKDDVDPLPFFRWNDMETRDGYLTVFVDRKTDDKPAWLGSKVYFAASALRDRKTEKVSDLWRTGTETVTRKKTGGLKGVSKQSGFVQRMMAEAKKKHGGEPYGPNPKLPSYKNPTAPLHPGSTMKKGVPFKFSKLASEEQGGENEKDYGASPFIIEHFGHGFRGSGKETEKQKEARKAWAAAKKAPKNVSRAEPPARAPSPKAAEEEQRVEVPVMAAAPKKAAAPAPKPAAPAPVANALPATKKKAAEELVRRGGWTIKMVSLRPENDTMNKHNGKVFPNQFLLVDPSGETGWWIWTMELNDKVGAESKIVSRHKFYEGADGIWIEDKPPGHSPDKKPWTNVFYYLVWDKHKGPFPSYDEWKEQIGKNTSWRDRDGKYLKDEAFYRERYADEKERAKYYVYLF